jgi:hypothetical protein
MFVEIHEKKSHKQHHIKKHSDKDERVKINIGYVNGLIQNRANILITTIVQYLNMST